MKLTFDILWRVLIITVLLVGTFYFIKTGWNPHRENGEFVLLEYTTSYGNAKISPVYSTDSGFYWKVNMDIIKL